MATPDFNVCDICGERVAKEHRIWVATDRHYDGIDNVTDGENIDLCPRHLAVLVMRLAGTCVGQIASFEMGKKVLEIVKGLPKK